MPLVTNLGLGYLQALMVVLVVVVIGIWSREVRLPNPLAGIGGAVYRRRAWVGPLILAIILSGLGSDAIKGAFSRHRPWWFYEEQHRAGRFLNVHVRTVPGVYPLKVHGFPSGHTATSVALATGVTVLFWRRRGRRWAVLLAWMLAGAITFSRIYLASHWPLDLLGGAVLGAASGVLSVKWCEAWARHRAMDRGEHGSTGTGGHGGRATSGPSHPITRSPDHPAA